MGQPGTHIQKKALKTKTRYIITFGKMTVPKEILMSISSLLPSDFYISAPYLGGYKISAKENASSIEKLPYPVVLYPYLGSFFAFKKTTDDSLIYFCSCMKDAIRNCIEISII